jgi:Xaa-Pro aminopeptidase
MLIEPGMVINVETPYYELGFGGVTVEDTMVITEEGFQFLTESSRELRVLT